MATEEDTDTLKLYWDHFFKAETGTYEKSTWLDLFLAEFLIRVNNGADPKELIKFCPVSGVVSLVGCELLCGIHRVTSSINTHYSPLPCLDAPCSPAPETRLPDTLEHEQEPKLEPAKGGPTSLFTRNYNTQSSEQILRKYLLGGVAWRCLALLKALGVEGLSCCRQLSSVLIWLFGELAGAGDAREGDAPAQPLGSPAPRTVPIQDLFSHRIWSNQKPTGTQASKVTSAASSEKGSSARSRHAAHSTKSDSIERVKSRQSKHADLSSESADSNDDLQILNRSLAIKVCTPNDDFEYFNSTKSSNEYPNDSYYSEPFYTPRKTKPKADDYINDKHREIINSEISTFQFKLIITDLLQELCKAESSLTGSEGSQISMQCINFSLRNLCNLQFSSTVDSDNRQEASRTKVALTELLMVSLDQVLIHSDLCAKLINNGILPMLLRLLEDVISKRKSIKPDPQRKEDETESENLLNFVFGIAFSITAFFHCLLMQCRTVDKLREFTEQFKLYAECLKGGLLKECIELMTLIPGDEERTTALIKKLIETVGRLIAGMKRVRSEVVHGALCARARHKACRARVAAGAHHHHALLALGARPACAVAALYAALAALLPHERLAARKPLRHKLLRVLLACGGCCCLSPAFLMENVVRLVLTHDAAAPLCLRLLERAVYGELGAGVLLARPPDQLPCAVCEPGEDRREAGRRGRPPGGGPAERKSVWSFLYHYNSLLQLDNHNNVLHATVSHLLRVTPRCRTEMKHELLFGVIYPTFIVAKHRYMIRTEESAFFLTASCLNIFVSLLNTVSFAEQFIQKGGLSYVLELVSLSEFSNQCCSILEIAIVVEIFKLMKENPELTHFQDISSLSSVQMLIKSLSEMTDKGFRIYKLKLPADEFEELCDVSAERETLAFVPPAAEPPRRPSSPRSIEPGYASHENTVEETVEDHVEVLKTVWTFWKTCASLCLCSPPFREHVVGSALLLDSYALLKLLLRQVCAAQCAGAELRVAVRVLEALLTVQLAASDVTAGRSKQASCSLVRAALGGAPPWGGGAPLWGGGGLRALCDALIRVAAAAPSAVHAMPRRPHAKVPPLVCASGASSSCSSSEDSVAGPYASEHSEPPDTRPDEGYEADVEVGKLDLTPLFRTRKLSASTANTSGIQSPSLEMSPEFTEYKNGELAHPELCVIVVDILAQLVNKLVSSRADGSWRGAEWRAGAGAARAWAARVRAALARQRVAHPPLLRRLLAAPKGHPHLLAITLDALEDLQRSILELVHVLAAQSIEPAELAAFLRLFTAENPPLGMLLDALHRLFAAATSNTPDCILSFPVDTDNTDGVQSLSEELGYVSVSSATSQSHAAESAARALRDQHRAAGRASAWAVHAVRVGAEGTGWAPWLAGFALSAWLQPPALSPAHEEDTDELTEDLSDSEGARKKSPQKEGGRKPVELSHVVSVGHESLLLELWLDVNTGSLVLRLRRAEALVSEARAGAGLRAGRWACVALNVKELVHKRHLYIQVTIFVNGYECETVSLPVQGILVRKVTPTCVLVGHAAGVGGVGAGAGAYHLSGVSVYRAPVLAAPSALHLAAHGPDHACQVRCESPNYALVLTPEVLDMDIDWDQVFEISATTLRELHDNLLLTFSAQAPNIMNLYHQSVALPTVFSGRVPPGGAGPGGGGAGPGGSIPEALFPAWAGAPLASRHRGVAPALYLLGGTDVLLYLYAKVVELQGSPAEQARALGTLLLASGCDNRLHAALFAHDALDMLLTVLRAPACHVSHHLLKVILDSACSAPLLSSCGDSVQLAARTDAVLLQPELLVLLAKAWRHLDKHEITWEVETGSGVRESQRGTAWCLTLCCIRALLRDAHPRRAFNHYQMCRHELLHHLLQACKERFLNSDSGPLSGAGSSSLVAAVRGLLGAPPLLHRLAMLCDFLLLMHQASDTFVTHSRANFYFLLTSETLDMSDFVSSSVKNRGRGSRGPRQDQARGRPSSGSDDLQTDNSLNVHKDNMSQSQQEPDDRIDSSSSTDSTKQMKSIINQQIKEGRTNTASSTSDNSDTPAPEEARAELTDYIVVDVDDVQHTTVEMYSSGIYHQRRVRAGAAAGWSACEGLLLLLRHALALLPDHQHQQAAQGAVSAESLAVLSNTRAARERAAALRAAAALTRRAAPDLARRLQAQHYYIHLANQISLYESSWELAAAAAALLTKCDVPLEDQLDDDIWVDIPEEALHRSPPVLALLAASVADVPLAHNLTRIARRVVDKASLKVLNEICLVEVVVRSLRALGQLPDDSFEGRQLLLDDLCELLNAVAVKALSAPHSMQTISEMHHLLTYIELSGAERVARVARAAQVSLHCAQLAHLELRLRTQHATHANYFTTVLSSAVSLGGGGAGGAERGELAARHLACVQRAVSFLLTRSPALPLHADELLFDRLLHTLLLAVSGSGAARPRWWVVSGADWAAPLQELFWWAAAPAPGARHLHARLLRALSSAPAHVLHALTPTDPAQLRKLSVYLLWMLQHLHLSAEGGGETVEPPITDWARAWAVSAQAELAERLGAPEPEALALLQADEERWARKALRVRPVVAKVVWSKDSLASKVTESAMGMTRSVVDAQNSQRKQFMELLRRAHAQQAAAAQAWQSLIDTHTHELAVWFEERCWPAAWQLDATEGPGRVRVRLRRARLYVQPRLLQPEHRHKAERGAVAPLQGVVGGRGAWRGGLVLRLQLHETVRHTARATCVTAPAELDGELLLSDKCIHFVPEPPPHARRQDRLYIPEVQANAEAQSWPLEALVQVATRRWCLQERAVELFLSSGHTHMLAFADQQERAAFLKALASCHHAARIEPDSLSDAMAAWRSGSITNWEYLMRLNGLGGRSYNDLMQYPVLPFVIADYTSKILDLNDPASFRDLSKPMAVQNKNREQHYMNIYNDLKAARREGCSPLVCREPHHYASLYSNSGGVLHYLVRLPPFTELFLNYQGNNFDMPDRTFHSLATTWRLITNDSPTDVKELIPELFYLPELFHNNEGLELGMRQCGLGVDDVELARWAADARLFTLIHRQALEAPLVTERLPHWIDLVFGYKQTGQAAVDAFNVFPACTYYGFDPLALSDALDRSAAEAMVRTYGQAPRQLLRAPHPHATADLLPHTEQASVWAGVVGARWGRWVGSPGAGAPRVCARRALRAASLHALPHARSVCACPSNAAMCALYGETSAGTQQSANGQQALGLMSWGHSDNMVRLKRRRDGRPDLLLHIPALDQIRVVSSSVSTAGCPFPCALGLCSGRVLMLRVRVAGGAARLRTRTLHAHRAPLSAIHICARAQLLATASEDGCIVLWDLYKLTYIRTLPNRGMLPVTSVTISETLCDVASVHDMTSRRDADAHAQADEAPGAGDDTDPYESDTAYRYESLIRVHTVNARFVGSVKVCERVTCICYSNAPEGVSVNGVAAGLCTGGVRVYSSWDLAPVLYVPPPDARVPLLSLTFSSDSSVLFGCFASGAVLAWDCADARPAPVRLLPAHALV